MQKLKFKYNPIFLTKIRVQNLGTNGFKAKFLRTTQDVRRCDLHHVKEQILSFPMVGGILLGNTELIEISNYLYRILRFM